MLWWLIGIPVAILLTPVATFFAIVFGSSLYIFVIKKWRCRSEPYSHQIWDPQRRLVFKLLCIHGWIFHGYQVVDVDRIPSEGPALIIFFHGTFPNDIYYLASQLLLAKRRLLIGVVEKNVVWGWQSLYELFEATPGSVDTCVDTLSQGKLLCIAPGGVREMLYSHNYQLMWGERLGFAKIALQAKVPIIPVFTRNSRELLKLLPIGEDYFRQLYETRKIGFRLFHGTFIGSPIDVSQLTSLEEIRQKVHDELEDLVHRHQPKNSGVLKAILERFS